LDWLVLNPKKDAQRTKTNKEIEARKRTKGGRNKKEKKEDGKGKIVSVKKTIIKK